MKNYASLYHFFAITVKKISLLLLLLAATFSLCAQWLPYKPVIGISASKNEHGHPFAPQVYSDAVIRAGGVPKVLAITETDSVARRILDGIDGLILTGGEDVAPSYYGEMPHPRLGKVSPWRDTYDMLLVRGAVNRGMPVLAICRGVQVLDVAFGGSLWQDIPAQIPGAVRHMRSSGDKNIASHTVALAEGSLLRRVACASEITVNSAHHQCVKRVAPGFLVTAVAPDGVVEAIELFDRRVIGVQFHPERMLAAGEDWVLPLFTNLVRDAARLKKRPTDNAAAPGVRRTN